LARRCSTRGGFLSTEGTGRRSGLLKVEGYYTSMGNPFRAVSWLMSRSQVYKY